LVPAGYMSSAMRSALAALKIRGVHFRRNFSIAYHRNKFVFPAMKNFIDMSCRYAGKYEKSEL
jgi:hypothetical protein